MEDDLGILITKCIAITLAIVLGIVFFIVFIYNVSGAKERDDKRKFDCTALGGEMIYIKGTGDVCIKGVIKID